MANQVAGYMGAILAALLWGSYAVPIKLIETGDGFVFQWIECSAILVIGLICEFIVGTYRIYPIAMLGGALWCLGNMTVVPIVNTIGLSMGLLIWGVSNLLTGWFCGHFGIFVTKEVPPHPVLNYIGLVAAVVSVALYLPVKSATKTPAKPSKETKSINESEYDKLETGVASDLESSGDELGVEYAKPKSEPFFSRAKLLGFGLSIFAGVLYGSNMIPVKYLQDRNPTANPLEFALSHYIGIWLTSTAFLLGYAIYKKNNPFVNPKSLLAAMLAGTGWGLAQAGGFIANANLGLTTSFPIICTGPGVIGALWGIFAFREIRGLRNYLWLGGAFALTFLVIILITLSKVPKL